MRNHLSERDVDVLATRSSVGEGSGPEAPSYRWVMLFLCAVLIGAGYAVSATMPPIIAADLFRGAGYGAIFGGISLASNTGSGVGTWLAGYIFDHTESYYLAFAIAIAGTLTSITCIWLAAPRTVRRVPGRPLSHQRAGVEQAISAR